MNNILSLSVAQLKRAIAIKEQIASLESELTGISGSSTPVIHVQSEPANKKVMSAAARAKIGAAQKARWATLKVTSTPAATQVATPPAAPTKKHQLSPEGRAKIVAAVKARWAAKKKGGK